MLYETSRQSRFHAWYWMLGAGALGWPRGMVWGGRREEGSGWGTHVYLWQIHFDIWQNQYNIVKLNKINILKKWEHCQGALNKWRGDTQYICISKLRIKKPKKKQESAFHLQWYSVVSELSLSRVWLFATAWEPARLLRPWEFSRQEYWSGLPCPPPGDLPNLEIESESPTLQVDFLPSEPPGKPKNTGVGSLSLL